MLLRFHLRYILLTRFDMPLSFSFHAFISFRLASFLIFQPDTSDTYFHSCTEATASRQPRAEEQPVQLIRALLVSAALYALLRLQASAAALYFRRIGK